MSKVPYLGDLKYINPFFRDKQATVRESELIVFITPTVIDMGYIGTPRQECIHNAVLPELDSIPHPKLPDYPCPTDQWPHRCGLCNKCNKDHCGECNGPTPGGYGNPGYEQLPPQDALDLQENEPTHSPVPVPAPPMVKTASLQMSRYQPVAAATKVSPFKTPVASKPVASKATVPPLMTTATVLYVPLERVSNDKPKTSRLPASATTELRPVQPAAARPVKLKLGQVRRLPSVDSEVGAPLTTPLPPSETKTSGPKRLTPAPLVHVSEPPVVTSLK